MVASRRRHRPLGPSQDLDVFIVGAGPAGLACAIAAARRASSRSHRRLVNPRLTKPAAKVSFLAHSTPSPHLASTPSATRLTPKCLSSKDPFRRRLHVYLAQPVPKLPSLQPPDAAFAALSPPGSVRSRRKSWSSFSLAELLSQHRRPDRNLAHQFYTTSRTLPHPLPHRSRRPSIPRRRFCRTYRKSPSTHADSASASTILSPRGRISSRSTGATSVKLTSLPPPPTKSASPSLRIRNSPTPKMPWLISPLCAITSPHLNPTALHAAPSRSAVASAASPPATSPSSATPPDRSTPSPVKAWPSASVPGPRTRLGTAIGQSLLLSVRPPQHSTHPLSDVPNPAADRPFYAPSSPDLLYFRTQSRPLSPAFFSSTSATTPRTSLASGWSSRSLDHPHKLN